jgi:HPt (histidine-containing phosphotransfer) domain-containing protein
MYDGVPIDSTAIQRLRDMDNGKGHVLLKLIGVFLEIVPGHIARLETACHGEDGERLFQEALILKSNCLLVGAQQMGILCTKLQVYGTAKIFDEAGEAIRTLENEYQRTKLALDIERQLENFKL